MSIPPTIYSENPVPIRLGVFLGVRPSAGGMFQYAQSLIEALAHLDITRFTITVAYGNIEWAKILDRIGLQGYLLHRIDVGIRIADIALALLIPGPLTRMLASLVNPLVRELYSFNCCGWIFPAQDSISYQLNGRHVGTIHDLMHRYERSFPEASSVIRYPIREHRFSRIAHDCAGILVDSEVGRQHVVESYGVDPHKVYPLPYIAPSYLNSQQERADFDEIYRLPAKFLFYPAQFWPHKNHRHLLEAIQRVALIHQDLTLVLAGGKRYDYFGIKEYASALGVQDRVHFVGYIPDADVPGFYRRARAMVMPTYFGPTNIPPLEALATGCPAVVSGVYGMPEQLGDAVLYFNPNDVSEIAIQISRIWSDDNLAAELSRRGLERSRLNDQKAFNARLAAILDHVYRPCKI